MDSTPDPAAALEEIRKRSEWASDRYAEMATVRESAEDVPPLAAALEAVLKLADGWSAPCAARDCLDEELIEIRRDHAAELRETITRELTGEVIGNEDR
jgi:hypothetical protein